MIEEIANAFPSNVTVLPTTKENYISFSVYLDDPFKNKEKQKKKQIVQFKFIDSLRFMSASLDDLAKNLDSYPIVDKYFALTSPEQRRLLYRKGVFPYEWLNCKEKLKVECLPPKESFYSTLNGSGITDQDYEHAQKVFEMFNMKSFAEYMELYMKLDVLLLADIFEAFCKMSMSAYGLDPCHYTTTPSLAWDAMLKMTNTTLELLTDIDMVRII